MNKELNPVRKESKQTACPRRKSKGTALRKKYIEDLNLAGYSKGTVRRYTGVMVQISKRLGKSPMYFTDSELRKHFKYLKEEKKLAPTTLSLVHAALKFFYTATYPKEIHFVELYRVRRVRKIPEVLSVGEVRRILNYVRDLRCHACLALIYSCGLRIHEAASLKVGDVDGARMLIHVRDGKGGKDRYVPLPGKTLKLLREQWKTHRHPVWLFPARRSRRMNRRTKKCYDNPINGSTISQALKYAVAESGCHKAIKVHTFRHSYATHLLEAGVPLHVVQSNLGHASLSSTGVYTHMTDKFQREAAEKLEALMNSIL
ncbi:MAG: tyrosine-type recombinase/integrase [Dehalococcoidales bacterium]|nr:tyrosine-type recombinase/integrase [Dehalococcoidales bacterium]MDD3127485.1 tyrosine-type recombinase/integrase [Candidatus Izemoplasmatales bacterium]